MRNVGGLWKWWEVRSVSWARDILQLTKMHWACRHPPSKFRQTNHTNHKTSQLKVIGDHSRYGSSQWETTLHCNVVSHWLSLYPGWPLAMSHWPLSPWWSDLWLCNSHGENRTIVGRSPSPRPPIHIPTLSVIHSSLPYWWAAPNRRDRCLFDYTSSIDITRNGSDDGLLRREIAGRERTWNIELD